MLFKQLYYTLYWTSIQLKVQDLLLLKSYFPGLIFLTSMRIVTLHLVLALLLRHFFLLFCWTVVPSLYLPNVTIPLSSHSPHWLYRINEFTHHGSHTFEISLKFLPTVLTPDFIAQVEAVRMDRDCSFGVWYPDIGGFFFVTWILAGMHPE